MESIILNLNNSKLFVGCSLILMNIGSRYIIHDLPKTLDNIFKHNILRKLVIFCIIFVAIRDIKMSILITLLYVLIFNILIHEKSAACILPNHYLDFNGDGEVSPEEIEKAKAILSKYKIQNASNVIN